MRLIFKRNKWLDEFHGNGIHLRPGESQDIPEQEAEGLLRDFPENFSVVASEAFDKPPADKQIKGAGAKVKVK